MTTSFTKRRRLLLERLREAGIKTLLVTNPASWYYLTGFTGDAGALLVFAAGGATLITDGRFTGQAKEETTGIHIVAQEGTLAASVGRFLSAAHVRQMAFEPSGVTVAQWRGMQRAGGRGIRWIEAHGVVEGLRERKGPDEIAQMRKATRLADEVIEHAIALLKPGVRELEIAAEIEYRMRELGASGPAFATIVAFGDRAALPHAHPTAKRLRKNDLVVLDLGAILGHYCSDMTRTVVCGQASTRVRGWYRGVQEAQAAAIDKVRAGTTCEEVDAAARNVLKGYRLDRYFIHSTGHGLGLEVHEGPRLAQGQKQVLVPGNVITIEPGVYVPGVGGIRIEDDVVVQENGTEVLTRVSRDLIEI